MYVRSTILTALSLLLLSPAALATPFDSGSKAAFRFELRALGAKVGEAVLSIGKEKKVAGKKLRPVRIDAKTEGLGAQVYMADANGTSWVDEHWMPVRARWDSITKKGKQTVKAKYDGKSIDAKAIRNGKVKRKVKRKLRQRTSDLISAFAWLLTIDMQAGQKVKRPIYDGRVMFHMTATVGHAQEIIIPLGPRKAVPIKVLVTRGSYKRLVVYWVDPVKRTPYKVSFDYGVLGDVDALLIGEKQA